jgi:uncharacterized protein (DUF1697 family)
MSTFVALLRGINAGKAKRIAIADLRALLDSLGYATVVTLLNSGNIVFSSPKSTPTKHATAIANATSSELQIEVPVIVKSASELSAIVTENSFSEAAPDHSRLLVAFVQDPKQLPGLAAIEPLIVPPEQFMVGRNAAYSNQ